MKYHFICFLDIKVSSEIQIREAYRSYDNAVNNMEKVAVKHIKKKQGAEQVELCKQYNKTINEIELDPTLKEGGLYIMKEADKLALYEKVCTVQGTFWSSKEVKLIKIGTFSVVSFDLDVEETKCNCNVAKSIPISTNNGNQIHSFIDELKKRFDDPENNFGLRVTKIKLSNIDSSRKRNIPR